MEVTDTEKTKKQSALGKYIYISSYILFKPTKKLSIQLLNERHSKIRQGWYNTQMKKLQYKSGQLFTHIQISPTSEPDGEWCTLRLGNITEHNRNTWYNKGDKKLK